ncbi:DUF721 domain-containing protein [Streptomyces dangxiongensis]|uniref:DUF721 domain-containing protein n=1 Tax=Streptomyces dangxiongensis TaxID=1442032 RepID=A0A3G2JF32_9ACTN|nr:DciA family protein [Streptomyces dangxiongensis]AYN40950.1 DUF721 domain-containing protein [Streptomyces dangxiongensis]
MSTFPRLPGAACCPARDRLNDVIRRLMGQPATRERAEQYARLLERWAEICPPDGAGWTTAA